MRRLLAVCVLLAGTSVSAKEGVNLSLHVLNLDKADVAKNLTFTKKIRLSLRVADALAFKAVASIAETDIDVLSDHRVDLVTYPDSTVPSPPGTAHLVSSFLVDFDEPEFATLVPDLRNRFGLKPKIVELEQFVDQHINKKSMLRGFDYASKVARNQAGDCTEHAVLLTALARATGQPARVVVGYLLVRRGGELGLFGHAWSEVYQSGRWVVADASWPKSRIGNIELRHFPMFPIDVEGPGYSRQLGKVFATHPEKVLGIDNG